jgi:Ca2+/H+ antiporter
LRTVARAILGIGAAAWSIGCLVAVAVALVGVERLIELLPPLQVDTDAVRGAVVAAAVALALLAGAHLLVIGGLRAGRRRARSAGILLAALLTAILVALAAAAFTSAAAGSGQVVILAIAGIGAAALALAYGLAAAHLVGELRAGDGS